MVRRNFSAQPKRFGRAKDDTDDLKDRGEEI